MFFVFGSGNPNDGEAAGGLADMKGQADTLPEAQAIGEAVQSSVYDVEILCGTTGQIWDYTAQMTWALRS